MTNILMKSMLVIASLRTAFLSDSWIPHNLLPTAMAFVLPHQYQSSAFHASDGSHQCSTMIYSPSKQFHCKRGMRNIFHSNLEKIRGKQQGNFVTTTTRFSSLSSSSDGEEDILLRVNFSVPHSDQNEAASSLTEAMNQLREYVRSFPFAAVLPVQPLQYLPTDDGVDVTFLRKKTKEKGSVDGGIVFMVNEEEEESGRFHLVARRNSEGQTVGKIFSEKLVILAVLDKLEDSHVMKIESTFHKWM